MNRLWFREGGEERDQEGLDLIHDSRRASPRPSSYHARENSQYQRKGEMEVLWQHELLRPYHW